MTDHKPLVPLIELNDIHDAPIRCQRILMRLVLFNIQPAHVPGEELVAADTLSRSSIQTSHKDVVANVDNVQLYVDAIVTSWLSSTAKLTAIRDATRDDQALQRVLHFILNGWPAHPHVDTHQYRTHARTHALARARAHTRTHTHTHTRIHTQRPVISC